MTAKSLLLRELETRDQFLAQVSRGLDIRIAALGRCQCRHLDRLREFARELSIITGDEKALVPRKKRLDIGPWITKVVARWRKRLGKRGEIRLHVDGDTRAAVDPAELESIVAELLSNALKYGAPKPVELRVEGRARSIRIVIEDRGPGLERNARRGRLFVRGAPGRQSPGFGVGLWLTRRLVRAHRGRFRLLTPTTGGTRAVVELPRR
jgi:signal transduction histidine kinase